MDEMQIITHSHNPYGNCQVDIHSSNTSSFITAILQESFFSAGRNYLSDVLVSFFRSLESPLNQQNP